MAERILTKRRGTKRRTGTIYKEQQRNTGHRSNSGGRHCGVQYVRGVGRVVRSRWVAVGRGDFGTRQALPVPLDELRQLPLVDPYDG